MKFNKFSDWMNLKEQDMQAVQPQVPQDQVPQGQPQQPSPDVAQAAVGEPQGVDPAEQQIQSLLKSITLPGQAERHLKRFLDSLSDVNTIKRGDVQQLLQVLIGVLGAKRVQVQQAAAGATGQRMQ